MNPSTLENNSHPQLIPIIFEFRHSSASSVCVAGSFNDWNPQLGPMTRDSRDHWVRTIPLSRGYYEYCLVVDGQWILDPLNQLSVENPFGGRNSLFNVDANGHCAHNQDAERNVMSGAPEERRAQLHTFATKACEAFATPAGFNSTAGRTCLGPRAE
jgi:hypothetical protein